VRLAPLERPVLLALQARPDRLAPRVPRVQPAFLGRLVPRVRLLRLLGPLDLLAQQAFLVLPALEGQPVLPALALPALQAALAPRERRAVLQARLGRQAIRALLGLQALMALAGQLARLEPLAPPGQPARPEQTA